MTLGSTLGQGHVALVTGGTSGIGRALVEALHARGTVVWFCARNAKAVAALQSRLPATKGHVCDVTVSSALTSMANEIENVEGRLDVLMANVGAMHQLDFTKAPLAENAIRSEIDLNLTSAVLTVNAFLPALTKSSAPHIVVVGSGYGWSPAGSAPLYSAAKAGLRAFVKSLRAQLHSSGFHVMEVVPPAVDTPGVVQHSGPRLAPSEIARVTLRGIDRMLPAVFAGQTRLIPFMLRVAPAALERMTLRS